ncbi:MAG: NAD(P)/FAD-dependent oxidoreductase [Gemmobacter sp.]
MACDFLIIGGGIAGISAAAALAPLGRVVVLEAEAALAYHASGRSAALYEPRYGNPAVRALTAATGPRLRAVDGGVLSPRGLMIVARADEAEEFAADVASMGLHPIEAAEACALVPALDPAAVALAAHHPDAEDIDTDRLIQHLARAARAAGAEIRTGAPVLALARAGAGWLAETPAGAIGARTLVNAAGAWADRVAALGGVRPLGLVPHRRSIARIAAPGGADTRGWPMLFGPGERWYAKPDAGALIVSPADEDPAEPHDAWPDDLVLAEGLARWQAVARHPVTRPLATWAGLRTFAPDRALVIGPDPAAAGFFWLAGQGGYGFQTSLGAAALLADLVAGRAPDLDPALVTALSPARFG